MNKWCLSLECMVGLTLKINQHIHHWIKENNRSSHYQLCDYRDNQTEYFIYEFDWLKEKLLFQNFFLVFIYLQVITWYWFFFFFGLKKQKITQFVCTHLFWVWLKERQRRTDTAVCKSCKASLLMWAKESV